MKTKIYQKITEKIKNRFSFSVLVYLVQKGNEFLSLSYRRDINQKNQIEFSNSNANKNNAKKIEKEGLNFSFFNPPIFYFYLYFLYREKPKFN